MSPEDFADAEMARHNRSLLSFDFDASDVWCDCDSRGCQHTHDDCDCPRECERHETHECPECCKTDALAIVRLDCGEHFHVGCLQSLVNDGEFTRDDLSEFADTLTAHGIVFPEAPVEAAAE